MSPMESKTGKIGILAGGGRVATETVRYLQRKHIPHFVVKFRKHADAQFFSESPGTWVNLPKIQTTIDLLHSNNVKTVVMVGTVGRPKLSLLWRLDRRGRKIFFKMFKESVSLSLSRHKILNTLIEELSSEGFTVCGPQDVVPDFAVRRGALSKVIPDDQVLRAAALAVKHDHEHSTSDVQQACIVVEGKCVITEGPRGTDAMINEFTARNGKSEQGVLVKFPSPGQNVRADTPVIGLQTVESAVRAGLIGIIVRSGSCIIVDQQDTIRKANQAGLFIYGDHPADKHYTEAIPSDPDKKSLTEYWHNELRVDGPARLPEQTQVTKPKMQSMPNGTPNPMTEHLVYPLPIQILAMLGLIGVLGGFIGVLAVLYFVPGGPMFVPLLTMTVGAGCLLATIRFATVFGKQLSQDRPFP